MGYITTEDEIQVSYKEWGSGQPIVFSHGWPLSADDWDPQMLFFLSKGYRVIAHDRRGHGRSTRVADGHELDHGRRHNWASEDLTNAQSRITHRLQTAQMMQEQLRRRYL